MAWSISEAIKALLERPFNFLSASSLADTDFGSDTDITAVFLTIFFIHCNNKRLGYDCQLLGPMSILFLCFL